MDISKILPLLGGDDKTAMLLKAAGGDRSALLSGLAGNNPETAKILGLMNELTSENKKPQRQRLGISAVAGFANNDIIGMLYKMLR